MPARPRLAGILLVVLVLVAPFRTGAAQARQLSLEEYVSTLDRLASAVDALDERRPDAATALTINIPRSFTVTTSDRQFQIDTDWIRRAMTDWMAHPDPRSRSAFAGRLRAIRDDAARYATPPRDAGIERARLDRILADPEFKKLKGPGWFERLRQRVMTWLINLLGSLLGSSAIPTLKDVLVYAIIALVVVIVAIWMYRALKESAAIDSIRPAHMTFSPRAWQAWLDDARAAAARGEWHDAIHLAYWCGIAFLETQGTWRPDLSRTPREYLRAMPASHVQRPVLQALTRELEQVWYGAGRADADAFADVLAHLKKLGCPSL